MLQPYFNASAMTVARFFKKVAYEPSEVRAWVVNCTTFTPVSSPMVFASAGEVPSSVKIALTGVSWMACYNAAMLAADTAACEERLGMITPTSLNP